jgi:hypothetical protein
VSARNKAGQQASRRHVSLIVRLVLDERSRLIRGSVVDVHNEMWGSFVRWADLTRMIRRRLSEPLARQSSVDDET